jgi:hypothetical protein
MISTPDDSVFGTFLLKRIAFGPSGQTKTASSAEWLKRFNECKEYKATKSARWPKTPSTLGNDLRRLDPTLCDRGVVVTFEKNRQGFSHRHADAKSLLDEALRRGMVGAAHRECFPRASRKRSM